MKHLTAILAALVSGLFGIYVVAVNARGVTTPHLLFGAGFVLLGLALAIPAQLQQAICSLAPLAGLLPGVHVPASLTTAQPQAEAAPEVDRAAE